MNLGMRTYTPFVTLLDMPILEYMRYERLVIDQIEKAGENR